MTGRENLLRVLRGEKPGWVPCSINVNQWFGHHQRFGLLPEELKGSQTNFDVMKQLGCDLFVRMDGGLRGAEGGPPWENVVEAGSLGKRTIRKVSTPFGELRSVCQEQEQFSSVYQEEDLIKDWERDQKAYRWVLERSRAVWDAQAFARSQAIVGDQGLVLASTWCTPLKKLHHDFGLDGACLFVMDQPEEAQELCDLFWRGLWPGLQQMAASDEVTAVCFEDNVDTPFYPPGMMERYWVPYVRQTAELFHERGKFVFVHACGKLHDLKQALTEAKVDGLDGMPHPPLGDWTIEDARSMPGHFVYDGGFGAHEQVTKNDEQVEAFYADFFTKMKGHDRFIFAAACQTAITTRWERIKKVVSLCREYGGRPY